MNHIDKQIKDLEVFVALEVSRIKNWKEGDRAVNWLGIRDEFQGKMVEILSGKKRGKENKDWGIANRHSLPNPMQMVKVFEVFDLFVTEVENAYEPEDPTEREQMNPVPPDNEKGNIKVIEKFKGKNFYDAVVPPANARRLNKNDYMMINAIGHKVRETENKKIFWAIIAIILLIGGLALFLNHLKKKRLREAMELEAEEMYPTDDLDDEYAEYTEVADEYGDVPETADVEPVGEGTGAVTGVVKVIAKAIKTTTAPSVSITDDLA